MKMTYQIRHALTGVFLISSLLAGRAQINSPVGDWDCVMSGSRQSALLMLHFDPLVNNVGTIDGYAIFSSSPKKSGGSTDGRPGSTDPDRGGGGGSTSTNTPVATTNVFGFSPLVGQWGYDSSGKVVGYYSDSLNNAYNFSGKAVANKRFTLMVTTPMGKVSVRGIPLAGVTDMSGSDFDQSSWYGIQSSDGQDYQEFLDLSSLGTNLYGVDGEGPTYAYSSENSFCIISQQKKIGFSVLQLSEANTNGVLRASIGSFKNGTTVKSSTKGVIEPDSASKFNVNKF